MPNIRTPKLPFCGFSAQASAMPDRPQRKAIALCAWLSGAIFAGAWSAHFFYNGGKALADVARRKPINAPLDWLARICDHASFADVHRISIIFTFAVAALPCLRSLFRKPDGVLQQELVMARQDRHGMRQAMPACLLCTGCSLVIALLLHGRPGIVMPESWIPRISGAFVAGLVIEAMFRGVSLRIFTEAIGPGRAKLASALAYVLVANSFHPHGIAHWVPGLSSERFPLVRTMIRGLADPSQVFLWLLPLFLLGLCMAWTRTRSASLWLVSGIQTGVLLSWSMTSHPMPGLLAGLATVYVFCGCPAFRNQQTS